MWPEWPFSGRLGGYPYPENRAIGLLDLPFAPVIRSPHRERHVQPLANLALGKFNSWQTYPFGKITSAVPPRLPHLQACPPPGLLSEPRYDIRGRHVLARTVAAPLELDLAFGDPLRSDHDLPGNADQVGGRELDAGALLGVVIEHVDALGRQLAIELLARRISIAGALLQVEDDRPERSDRLRPLDAGVVVTGFDDGADQTGDADAIGTAMDRHFGAIGAGNQGLHRVGIFGAEIEDLADLDAPRVQLPVGRHLALEARRIMHVLGCGIDRGPLLDDRREIAVVIHIIGRDWQIEHVAITKDRGLAGFRQHDELMTEVAADWPRLRSHRDRLQSHACKGAQVSDKHLVVRPPRPGLVDVEGIGVLHQEFTTAHDAEPRALLVAEFPLNMIEIERQAPVRLHIGAEDLGDHFLVGRPVQKLALVPVGDAQHLRAIRVIATALAPEIRKLQCRHEQFERTGAVLLLAHDLLDLLQDAKAERQPRIDAGSLLPHPAGAQHQPMRHDLRFLWIFLQNGQEEQ